MTDTVNGNHSPGTHNTQSAAEAGIALLLTMFVLAMISILGLIMTMSATTEAQISDNSESHLQAVYAAISGLEHARLLARNLDFDAMLQGPDGSYDTNAAYLTEAKQFRFRLLFPIMTAQKLDLESPLAGMGSISDDGVISTGAMSGTSGVELIPKIGIGQWADNPYGPGTILTSRYFVKVTDNNGEASELAADTGNNPFVDGDGIIIVRSIGASRTFSERIGGAIRRNSVAVYESRLKRTMTWDPGPALTIIGTSVGAVFTGTPEISGGSFAGIGVLDTDTTDTEFPEITLKTAASVGTITGGGLPEPSVRDITIEVQGNRDKAKLSDPVWLHDFINQRIPRLADTIYAGNQLWTAAGMPFLGAYDKSRSWNDPTQNPRITLVSGDLTTPEGLSGAGILVVTGALECTGTLDWRGLVLVLGEGNLILDGDGPGISGGVVTGKLINSGGGAVFGTPEIAIGGLTRIAADQELMRMAMRMFPAEQISFREIAGTDP